MIKVKCGYCGKWTYKFYSCQLPDYDGEGYCCEDCAKKHGIIEGPYVANKARLYDNTAPLTQEEKERLAYYHMSALQKIKYKLSKAFNKSV